MNMDSTVVVEILLGLLTVTVGFVTFIAASRTQRQQSVADQTAVDAAAYERAKEIYESALQTLHEEWSSTRSELLTARSEIMSLRAEIARLREELKK
jgi:predicted RNase H-like nuclease (RuvC/YqgF family)